MTSGNQHEDIANGIRLAKAAAVAHLEGDEAETLRLINSASGPGELANALGYALGMVNTLAHAAAGGDEVRARGLVAAGVAEDMDVMNTQMRLMTLENEQDDE